jgi:hypothetical protein
VAKYDGPSISPAQDPASPSPVDAIIAGRRSRKTTRSTSQRHGLTRLKAAVRGLGSRVVDRRTTLGKALAEWRQELTQDLGGPDAVSTQQRAIVDLAVRTKFLLDSIDAWLLTQPSLVNKRTRSLLPVVRERQQLADSLSRYLQTLGLERRARPAKTLAEVIEEIAAEKEARDGGSVGAQ